MVLKKMVLLLLLAMIILTGCTGEEPEEARIVIAQGVDATTLDPHIHNETTSANVTGQIFDSLFTRSETMELVPMLAESVDMVDELTWEVVIRDGIRFHNGEVFDAETVRFSIERILDPENGSPQISSVSMIERVEVVAEDRIRIITKNPYPLLPSRLTMAMVPAGYIREVGSEGFAQAPVGTGPYTFVRWTKDEEVVLAANEEYFEGRPPIEHVVFRVIPESSVRIAELTRGQVDLISNVPPHQTEALEDNPQLAVATVPSGRIIFIQWVTDNEGVSADPLVRKAVQYGVDVETIIDTILEGYGVPLNQPLTTFDFGYHDSLPAAEYNPDKARALLAQAGFEEGLTIVLDSPVGRYSMDKEIAQAIAGQLEDIGVQVQLNLNEWGVHVGKILDRQMENGYLIGWGSSLFDADATLYPNFHSEQRISFYKNSRVDTLLEQARQTMDHQKRQVLYHEALEIIMQEAAALPLFQPVDIYGIRSRLQWQPRADEMIYVRDMSIIQ